MYRSPYKIMWVLALFDLPTQTGEDKKAYRYFHKFLVEDGFTMMQYSVYSRFCPSVENAEVHTGRIQANLPPEGEVRVLQLTSKQFELMKIFCGKLRKKPKNEPEQLLLF